MSSALHCSHASTPLHSALRLHSSLPLLVSLRTPLRCALLDCPGQCKWYFNRVTSIKKLPNQDRQLMLRFCMTVILNNPEHHKLQIPRLGHGCENRMVGRLKRPVQNYRLPVSFLRRLHHRVQKTVFADVVGT